MPRTVSFIVLIAIVLLVMGLFFQVMVQFILPLFLAAVLVVVFRPVHEWMLEKCGNRSHLAAGLTTLTILLIVLLPLCGMLWNAYSEGIVVATKIKELSFDDLWNNVQQRVNPMIQRIEKTTGLDQEKLKELLAVGLGKLRELALPLVLGGMKLVVSMAFGLAIMMLAVFYFFADGPGMVRTIMRLSPLDDRYELQLLDQFSRISRTVVIATLLSAVVQGLLAGIGYYFAGVEAVFFLTGLTMLLAMVPFVGAAAVWAPTCVWLYLFGGGTGQPTAAILLAIYGALVVSMADNVIKPLILHGQSNLHPLVALLSILGGAQVLGPIGILVGPMLVAFLQALLEMLRLELENFDRPAKVPATDNAAIQKPPNVTSAGKPEPVKAELVKASPKPQSRTQKKRKRRRGH